MLEYRLDDNNRICDLFPFLTERGHVVSVVGAGGKTSIIYAAAADAAERGMNVVVNTTTHIKDPRCGGKYEDQYADNPDDVERLWQQGRFAIVGTPVDTNVISSAKGAETDCELKPSNSAGANAIHMDKVSEERVRKLGPNNDFLEGNGAWKDIRENADLILIEADGSRHKPCKVPAAHEPVIIDSSDIVIGVIGGNAIGHRICDACFRPDAVAGFLDCDEDHVISKDDLIEILKSEKGTAKNTSGRMYYPVISYVGERIVIIRGGGDLATGVASELHRAGFRVLMLENDSPAAIRRKVSFSEAVYDGAATVEGYTSRLINNLEEVQSVWNSGELPIMIDPQGNAINKLKPDAVVDAIIAKRNLGTHIDMAPVTIGLGPGFYAGQDVDYVIETMRGDNLARIISEGPAMANTGIPGVIAGHSADRVIHAPVAGVIHPCVDFGDIVTQGQTVAVIESDDGNVFVLASLTGFIHGMIRDGYKVTRGFKIADIDPRIDRPELALTISDKSRKLGKSVTSLLCKVLY